MTDKIRIVSLDTETTTYSKGNVFDSRNVMCMAGVYDGENHEIYDIEYSDLPYGNSLNQLRASLESANLVVMFNAKFDLNWIRRYGIDYTNMRIWDCQLVHFILTHQSQPYPSLNQVAEYYGLGTKLDKIAEYWDNGIQTNDIDHEELSEYLKQDLTLTLQIYYKQVADIRDNLTSLKTLVNLSNMDTLVLADMEWNGLKYDFKLSKEKSEDLQEKLSEIDRSLAEIYDISGINWNSNDHLSAILYGGILKVPYRETYERILKDGTVKKKERNAIKEIELPKLVEPIKGTECVKEGYWKTSEDILKSLKAKGKAKQIIDLVMERSIIDKELNTYALGLPKLYEEKHYTDEIIHGRFNQCVTRTGRLSSSEPNLQNLSGTIKKCFITRFG
jgi:DNA polymerase I-like protein with 3'-5' exonuclease and polymerase domains